MAAEQEIGRLNVLLEFLSDCAQVGNLESLISTAGGRVRWVVSFQQMTLAIQRGAAMSYWSVKREDESLRPVAIEDVSSVHRSLIERVVRDQLPALEASPSSSVCYPLEARGSTLGAICFSNHGNRYTFEDVRFVHQIANCLGGTIARIDQAATIQRQDIEASRDRLALDTASATNRAKDEFLAILGHELRNPLAPILTALQLLRMRGAVENEHAIIERQVRHLNRLVDDLLDVSRIASGKVQLKLESAAINDIVASAVEITRPIFEERKHKLSIKAPSDRVFVSADPGRLSQAVVNVLTNAARYTEPGGTIAIEMSRAAGEVELRIRDNGVGIASDMLPRVFDLFAQERQPLDRTQGGLGLGLAIVRNLVTLHMGTVTLESEGKGHGSECIIRLPTVDGAESGRLPGNLSAKAWPPPVARERERRLLVVDDNQDAAELLAVALIGVGYQVRVAYDGVEALRAAKEFAPDAALLDIGLPEMNGYEVARHLRAPGSPPIRLIAITGYGQSSDREAALEAGFDVHTVKPVDLSAILAILGRLLATA